jgi:hypothetical protein
MTPQELIKHINSFSTSLYEVSKWRTTSDPFGHIDSKTADNYIYEFYCYMRILEDLQANYEVRFVTGTNSFPKKPANKSNGWARFDLHDKTNGILLFQVCAGTNVEHTAIANYTTAPDISFQTHDSPDTPNENHLLMILDSKYKTGKADDKKIDIATLREFANIVNDFNLDAEKSSRILLNALQTISGNCLVSNGQTAVGHQPFCAHSRIKQVGKFVPNEAFDVVG